MNIDRIKHKIDAAKVVSFDIFDTLIERDCEHPEDIFLRVGTSVLGLENAEQFQSIRKDAERCARKATPPFGEATLEEFYSSMTSFDEARTRLMEAERAQEIDSVSRKKDTAALFDYAKSIGKRIVLTTDMYLDRNTLTLMLDKCDIQGYEKMFISSEERCGKRNKLFDVVVHFTACKPCEIIHLGDNLRSDYIGPLRKGLKSVWLKRKGFFTSKLKKLFSL